ncbi:uncharacterized protein BO80DRAFT_428032 [Aspergillus ibericus CBS 121593]|uniref:Uncharacterized protein n=1 Tax=Aspergillus ibericus CBS 121593 TaxID=1448316 RepID=A0A395GQL1_9EURO|nr:hypothetical protein BO80DRAFT_428032 [Aspergillus ibericus CBS 121593]RAK97769.1 hypothetical protein BO80DRAFT_428032 [Aspergillus ibericus CBS 121593]
MSLCGVSGIAGFRRGLVRYRWPRLRTKADGVLHLAIICFMANVHHKQDIHAYHFPGYNHIAYASRRTRRRLRRATDVSVNGEIILPDLESS